MTAVGRKEADQDVKIDAVDGELEQLMPREAVKHKDPPRTRGAHSVTLPGRDLAWPYERALGGPRSNPVLVAPEIFLKRNPKVLESLGGREAMPIEVF